MDRFTAFGLIFVPAVFGGLSLAAWGGWRRGWLPTLVGLAGGTLLFWGGLLAAVGTYFSIWQAAPDPPDEAFSDGGSLIFVLFFGWYPGLALAGTGFAVARQVRIHRTRRASA